MKIQAGEMSFPEIQLKWSQLHKVRGYFGRQFQQLDLLHNHDPESRKLFYRYPAVQYKLVNGHPVIVAYKAEGIDILKRLFLEAPDILLDNGKELKAVERRMMVREIPFGEDGEIHGYFFHSPWIALNQKNYREYLQLSPSRRTSMLHGVLINNIISFCKFAGYTVQQRLEVASTLEETTVNLKGKSMLAFKGTFRVNFLLPDYLGLGKSSSRGYGNVCEERIN